MWSVRLRGPRGKQVVLQVDPDTGFKSFSELAAKEVGLKAKDVPVFRRGFPPRAIEVDGATLIKNVLEANDTVVVDAAAASSGATQATPSTAKTRAKRAPAKKTAAPKEKAARGGVHTLHPPTAKKKTAAAPKRKIAGNGHQLGSSLDKSTDSVAVNGDDDEQPQQKYRRTKALQLTSKDDVAINLVNAVSGNSHDRAAKFFRAATKSAVEHQYEITLATARLNAALSHNFEIEELSTTRRADGSAAQLRVRFKETPRKWKEETVDLLRENELQAIVNYVRISGGETGREMLKPFNMAQVSTRVFWSIARLYDGDVAAGLAKILPDEDWSFLDTRTRVMSEKAVEAKANEEHYKVWKRGGVSSSNPVETSPAAESKPRAKRRAAAKDKKSEVIAVDLGDEETKEEVASPKREPAKLTPALSATEATPITLRSAAAQAAVARLDRTTRTNAVVSAFMQEAPATTAVTTVNGDETETDDEVEEATTVYCDTCKKARILSPEEAAEASLDEEPWTCAFLVKGGRNGGCDAIDDELVQITGATIAEWLQKAAVTTRRQLADASAGAVTHALVDPLDPSAQTLEDKLDKFVDEARLDEVNDWMAETVGGDLVGKLELQKLGTPADLLTTPNDLILQAAGSDSNVSMETVELWQKRSKRLVEEHPWLGEWRTL